MNTDQIHKLLKKEKVESVLISSTPNIAYITNYNGFSQIEREAYLLTTHENTHLITDGRYTNAVKHLSKDLKIHEITSSTSLLKLLEKIISSENITSLGFESDNLTVSEYVKIKKLKIKLKPTSLNNLRVIKSPDEIKRIKKSCDIANKAFDTTKNEIKAGMSEVEVAWIFEKYVKEQQAELSFPTIVAFGRNSATPHHLTSNQKLKIDDTILIDCGVKYNNYCSDMTRTFSFGKPTEELGKIYKIVEKSQQLAIEHIQSLIANHQSIQASEIDKVARNHIVSQGYSTIPHSLGHGIGIEVHEAPRLSPTSKDKLEEGMAFSIEPGIYLPEIGGVRIEDLFTIQNNKLIQLTQ